MNNKILCSTGAYIGRENGFDYRLIAEYFPRLDCDALELMMLRAWYPTLSEVQSFLADCAASFEVIHSDKEIGTLLSLGSGDDTREAERLFQLSCATGKAVGAKKLVLHLWGGYASDSRIEYNISRLPYLLETADKYGLTVVTENVPCGVHDPFHNWRLLIKAIPSASLIFDTRFGAFHEQLDGVFDLGWFGDGHIKHIHVSDFAGMPGQFNRLRPIPMPTEGTIGAERFARFFSRLKEVYDGTITLESPAISEDGGIDVDMLNNALGYIRESVK